MAVSLLKQDDVLIARVRAPLSDADLLKLRDTLIERISQTRLRGVIVDVAGLDVVDSFSSRTLRELDRATRALGARAVIVGIQSDVAFAMERLGVSLEDVATASDVQAGLTSLGAR